MRKDLTQFRQPTVVTGDVVEGKVGSQTPEPVPVTQPDEPDVPLAPSSDAD